MIVKQDSELELYIKEKVNPSWAKRDFVDTVKMYWEMPMDCVLGVGGLRGMGKTVGLLQSIPDISDTLYICAQKIEDTYIDSADDILYILEKNRLEGPLKKYIIIDEYTWIKDRVKLDKSLYTYIQNGQRIAITGTESMTLELLNYGKLSHRVFMLHCNYFSYEEYLRIYGIEEHTQKTFNNYLYFGGMFEPYIIHNFKEMDIYIKDAIIESLCAYMDGAINEDQAKAIVYDILYKAICPVPMHDRNEISLWEVTPISLDNFRRILQIPPTVYYTNNEFSTAVDILKKIKFITEAQNIDDKNANKSRIYIVNPSITCQLFSVIYDMPAPNAYLGAVYEAVCASRIAHFMKSNDELYFLKGNSLMTKEQEIDFIIADGNKTPNNSKYAYYFECKHKGSIGLDKGVSILSTEIKKYFPNAYDEGRYVLYTGIEESYAFLDNVDIIFAPYISKLPEKYYDFEEQVASLKEKGHIFPKTMDNPVYVDFLNKQKKTNNSDDKKAKAGLQDTEEEYDYGQP